MRSATSSFKTLLKNDGKRGWPLCFLYTFILFFTVAVPVWNAGRQINYYSNSIEAVPAALRMSNQVYEMIAVMPVITMIAAIGLAMFLYAYLMRANSVGLMHALPVRRGTQFAAHFTAGMLMLTLGNVLVFVLTALLGASAGGLAVKPLLLWLVITELEGFFFLAFATLCASVTGWTLAVPVIYVGVNFMVMAYRLLLGAIASFFYRGYNGSDEVWGESFALWCTPVAKLVTSTGAYVTNSRPDEANPFDYGIMALRPGAVKTVLIYAVVGAVMLIAAYLFYKARHSETAGSPIVFPWLRPVVRYVIAIAGGLAMGMLAYTLLNVGSRNAVLLVLCQLVMGVLVYCAVEMLLRKTYKIFDKRSAVGIAALALVILLIPAAVKMDLFGYQRRVPDPDKVQAVEIYSSISQSVQTADPEVIAAAVDVHRALLDHSVVSDHYDSRFETYYFNVRYVLRDGSAFSRSYYYLGDEPTVKAAMSKLVNCNEVQLQGLIRNYDKFGTQFTGGYASNWMTGRDTVLTAEQCAALYAAAKQDARRQVDIDALYRNYRTGTRQAQLQVELTTTMGDYVLDNITADCTSVLSLLKEYGVFENDAQIFPDADGESIIFG